MIIYFFNIFNPNKISIALANNEVPIWIINLEIFSTLIKRGEIIPTENQAIDNPFKKSDKNLF